MWWAPTQFAHLRIKRAAAAVVTGPPLDSMSVSALCACSTRKLRAAYAGSALRVWRSSDSTEQDIGFSGDDLDTSSMGSFVGASTGRVVTWYDQSGNGNNLTRVGGPVTEDPLIVESGTIITKNSKAIVRLNGSTTHGLRTTATATQPDTVAAACKLVDAGAGNTGNVCDGITGRHLIARNIFEATPGTGKWGMYAGGGPLDSGIVSDDSWHGLIGHFNGSSSALFKDGTQIASGNAGTNASDVIFGPGGTIPMADFADVFIFASLLNASDRAVLTSSWSYYWAVP